MFNSYSHKKKDYCTAITGRCAGFLCEDYRHGICKGILWAIANKDGSIIAQMPPLSDEDENIWDLIMKTIEEIHNSGYLAKDEVIDVLESKYGIKLSKRMLKYYGTQEIIEPGIVTQLPGFKGSVSLYKENTPEVINFVNILKKHHDFTLKKIIEMYDILSFKNNNKLEQYWQHYEAYRVRSKGEKRSESTYSEKYDLEIIDFERFSILRALFELGNFSSNVPLSIVDVNIEKNENGQFEVIVKFSADPKKTVIFRKGGVKAA